MATPRAFSDYPSDYAELFIKAASEKVVVELKTEGEARRLRNRLYAYRTTLLREAELSPRAALLAPTVQLAIDNTNLIASPLEPAISNLDEALHGQSSSEVSRSGGQHHTDDSGILHGADEE